MLRISITNEVGLTRFKLEGKLAHEWVHEAETAWSVLRSLNGQPKVLIDLVSVTFVDEAGALLLARMRRERAKLVGSGLLIAALIEEIERIEYAPEVGMITHPSICDDNEGEAEI
jgi:anti-anti-sigma regulatory factor